VSVYASRWALEFLERNAELGDTARACLLILADEANHRTGVAVTGQPRLANLLRKHPDTIYRALRQLAEVVPMQRVAGKGTRWHFPVSSSIHTPRAEADAEVSTPPAPVVHTPRAHAGGSSPHPPRGLRTPPAPTRGKGFVSTDVETKEGAPEVCAQVEPLDAQPPRVVEDLQAKWIATQQPWVVEGVGYQTWLRRERAAGRAEPSKPRRRRAQ
jgi:hypothetical protein